MKIILKIIQVIQIKIFLIVSRILYIIIDNNINKTMGGKKDMEKRNIKNEPDKPNIKKILEIESLKKKHAEEIRKHEEEIRKHEEEIRKHAEEVRKHAEEVKKLEEQEKIIREETNRKDEQEVTVQQNAIDENINSIKNKINNK